MGHTEMLLAVAGLDQLGLKDRVSKLASGDWAPFPPEERAGLFFARKLTRTPWKVDRNDVATLEAHLGRERALDSIWYICWCNYMTRVADAFQLPLERENVFMPPKAPEEKKESRFPSLKNEEAWQRLPRPTPPLPAWAQILTA